MKRAAGARSTRLAKPRAIFWSPAPGLYSDRVAELAGRKRDVRIVPFRGEYYLIRPERQFLVRNLIYPVADPRFPFLGVHFTRRIQGGIEAGPNAVLAFAREGYTMGDVNLADVVDALAFPGLWRFLGKYGRTCWNEIRRSSSRELFCRSLQRLVPEIQPDDLIPGGSGVRAQAMSPEGLLVDDFHFVHGERELHVVNAPSPAATSSLAIGEEIAAMVAANSLNLRPRYNKDMTTPAQRAPQQVVERFFQFSLLGMFASGYFAVLGSGYMDWPTAILTLAALCVRALMVAGIFNLDKLELPGRAVAALTLLYVGFYPIDYYYISGAILAGDRPPDLLSRFGKNPDRQNSARLHVRQSDFRDDSAGGGGIVGFADVLRLPGGVSAVHHRHAFKRRSGPLHAPVPCRGPDPPDAVARSGCGRFPGVWGCSRCGLFAGILMLTAALFFVLPRTARAAFQRFVPERYHLPGFSNEVTLGEIGEIKQSSTPVMHVYSQGDGFLAVRWRGAALVHFDGKRWFNPPAAEERLRPEGRRVVLDEEPERHSGHESATRSG